MSSHYPSVHASKVESGYGRACTRPRMPLTTAACMWCPMQMSELLPEGAKGLVFDCDGELSCVCALGHHLRQLLSIIARPASVVCMCSLTCV